MQDSSAWDTPSVNESATPLTRADAEAGDAQAQFGVGFSFAAQAVPDYAQAMQWYRKAADQNHALAQFNLGQMFACGQGVERDDATAAIWMRRAAEGGDAGAQFQLGHQCERASLHSAERGPGEEMIECYKWFQLAAAQGYRDASARSDSATLRMSCAEVSEAARRVAAFRIA